MFKAKEVPFLIFVCTLLALYALLDRYISDPHGVFLMVALLMVMAYRRVGRPVQVPRAVAVVLVLLVIFSLNVAIFVLKINQELALVAFLTVLILAKSFALRKINDYSQLMFLSVLSLLAAGAYNPTKMFPIVAIAYTIFGGYAIYKTHLLTEVLAHRRIKKTLPALVTHTDRRRWFRPFCTACVITCAIAILIFSVIPRQTPNWSFVENMGNQQVSNTGFSQEITLGEMSNILQDYTPVLRVKHYQEEKQKSYNLALYLRGMVSAKYVRVGNTWKWVEEHSGKSIDVKAASPLTSTVPIQPAKGKTESHILWRISFEKPISSNLFVIDRPVSISTNQSVSLSYYPQENVISAGSQYPPKGFIYQILTEQVANDVKPAPRPAAAPEPAPVQPSPRRVGRTAPSFIEPEQARVVAIDPFKPIAQKVLGGLKPDAPIQEKAQKLETWLRSGFQYSLNNTDVNRSVEPVMDFLTRRKHGHCEYFASALAMLAQSVGMDAQVVTGFKGGVYNSFGDYFVVRNCDAHAWTEIYVPNRGWVSYDPTPPARDDFIRERDDASFRWVWDIVDTMQYSWTEKLANLGGKLRKQLINKFPQKVSVPGDPLADFQKWSINRTLNHIVNLLRGQHYESVGLQILHSFVALMVIVATVLLLRISTTVAGIIWSVLREFLRQRWEMRFGRVWFCPIDFYRKTLLWLQARGINRTGTETAGEFAERIGKIFPDIDQDMRYMTDMYLRARFARKGITPQQREKAGQAATQIQTVLTEHERNKTLTTAQQK